MTTQHSRSDTTSAAQSIGIMLNSAKGLDISPELNRAIMEVMKPVEPTVEKNKIIGLANGLANFPKLSFSEISNGSTVSSSNTPNMTSDGRSLS